MEQRIRVEWRIWLYVALIAIAIVIQQNNRESGLKSNKITRPNLIHFPPPEVNPGISLQEAWRRVKINPNDLESWMAILILYQQQGEWQSSISVGRRIIRIDPMQVNGFLGLVYAYVNLKQLDKAFLGVESALKQPFQGLDRGQLYRVRGDLWLQRYETKRQAHYLEASEAAYQAALTTERATPYAFLGLARVDILRNRLDQAESKLRQVVSRSPYARERAVAMYYLGVVSEKRGDIKTAGQWYEKALRTHPKSFRVPESTPKSKP